MQSSSSRTSWCTCRRTDSDAEASRSAITELTPALIGSTLTPSMVFVPLDFPRGHHGGVLPRAGAYAGHRAARLAGAGGLLHARACPDFLRHGRHTECRSNRRRGRRDSEAISARYERFFRWSLGHAAVVLGVRGADPGRDGGALLRPRQLASFRRWTRARSCSTTSCRPEARSRKQIACSSTSSDSSGETPETESYSRRTGPELGFAVTEPNTGDFLVKLKSERVAIRRGDTGRRCAAQDHQGGAVDRDRVRRAFVADLIGRSRVVAGADRDQDLRIRAMKRSVRPRRRIAEWLPR